MKDIVFINQDSGYLMIDIINAYAEKGYKCTLLTGRLVVRNIPLKNVVSVKRIVRYNRKNSITRLYSWIVGFVQIHFLVWSRYRNSHLFIVTNPPFAPLISLFFKNQFSLLFFDIYIDKIKEYYILDKILPVSYFWIIAHMKVLKKASYIFTLTEGMCNILEKYSGGIPVEIIPIWSDNSFLKPLPREKNPFLVSNNMVGKFIVLYSGNIGVSSGVETLLEVADLLKGTDLLFVIIGDGRRKEALLRRALEMNLKNCYFFPWQEVSVFPYSMAAASLAVITLAESASSRSIPSKLYNFMSVGAPVLCIANPDSDLAKTVKKLEIGGCFNHLETADIADYIKELYNNQQKCYRLRSNSLSASLAYTPVNAFKFVRDL